MPDTDAEASDDFVETLMTGYTDAWNREDIDAIESYYHVPFFSYQDGDLRVYLDAESSGKADAAWIAVNRAEGPATWERLSTSLTRLGRNSVLATTHWVFRRPDGTAVWDFIDSFHLCRFGWQWKFLNRTVHD